MSVIHIENLQNMPRGKKRRFNVDAPPFLAHEADEISGDEGRKLKTFARNALPGHQKFAVDVDKLEGSPLWDELQAYPYRTKHKRPRTEKEKRLDHFRHLARCMVELIKGDIFGEQSMPQIDSYPDWTAAGTMPEEHIGNVIPVSYLAWAIRHKDKRAQLVAENALRIFVGLPEKHEKKGERKKQPKPKRNGKDEKEPEEKESKDMDLSPDDALPRRKPHNDSKRRDVGNANEPGLGLGAAPLAPAPPLAVQVEQEMFSMSFDELMYELVEALNRKHDNEPLSERDKIMIADGPDLLVAKLTYESVAAYRIHPGTHPEIKEAFAKRIAKHDAVWARKKTPAKKKAKPKSKEQKAEEKKQKDKDAAFGREFDAVFEKAYPQAAAAVPKVKLSASQKAKLKAFASGPPLIPKAKGSKKGLPPDRGNSAEDLKAAQALGMSIEDYHKAVYGSGLRMDDFDE